MLHGQFKMQEVRDVVVHLEPFVLQPSLNTDVLPDIPSQAPMHNKSTIDSTAGSA
jgi:hypothetical protein